MNLRLLKDLNVAGKTVLLRTDYNVPLADGKVVDDFRLRASLPTIKYLIDQGCKVVIITHAGRPDGKVMPELSLRPIALRLADLLRTKVVFCHEVVGAQATAAVQELPAGGVLMLENLRFDAREDTNDPTFAKQLAALADVYVDDAFAVVHRAHASVVGVAKLLPSAAGLLVQSEVETIQAAVHKPKKPLLAVVGGMKVIDKIDLLKNLMTNSSAVLIGGVMANTFLASQGIGIGASKFEPEELSEAKKILSQARQSGVRIILPTDVVVAREFTADAEARSISLSEVGADDKIADLGPQTIRAALDVIKDGGSVIWNGPLGVTEFPQFSKATLKLARGIIASHAFSVLGGGDTASVIDRAGLRHKFNFVSTGGGATLELLAGKNLPGLVALQEESRVTNHESRVDYPSQASVIKKPAPSTQHQPRALIVANWKANTSLRHAISLAEAVNADAKNAPARVVLCPPALYLPLLRHGLSVAHIRFGAQDVSQFSEGTHTGELAASQLKQFVGYAIIGHSERRHEQHETDSVVTAKVAMALNAGIKPIICVGDNLHDREAGHAKRRVHDQLVAALHNVTVEDLKNVAIAYEPVWAISSGDGHGSFADPREVATMAEYIEQVVRARYGAEEKARVIYGGSVNADNAKLYLHTRGISGLLVGGASLHATEFSKIIHSS